MGVGNDCRPEDNNAENLPKGVNWICVYIYTCIST